MDGNNRLNDLSGCDQVALARAGSLLPPPASAGFCSSPLLAKEKPRFISDGRIPVDKFYCKEICKRLPNINHFITFWPLKMFTYISLVWTADRRIVTGGRSSRDVNDAHRCDLDMNGPFKFPALGGLHVVFARDPQLAGSLMIMYADLYCPHRQRGLSWFPTAENWDVLSPSDHSRALVKLKESLWLVRLMLDWVFWLIDLMMGPHPWQSNHSCLLVTGGDPSWKSGKVSSELVFSFFSVCVWLFPKNKKRKQRNLIARTLALPCRVAPQSKFDFSPRQGKGQRGTPLWSRAPPAPHTVPRTVTWAVNSWMTSWEKGLCNQN